MPAARISPPCWPARWAASSRSGRSPRPHCASATWTGPGPRTTLNGRIKVHGCEFVRAGSSREIEAKRDEHLRCGRQTRLRQPTELVGLRRLPGHRPGAVLPRRRHQVRLGPGPDGQADLPRLPGQRYLPELGTGQRPGGRHLGRPDRRRTTQAAPPRLRLPAGRLITTRGKVMTTTLHEDSGPPGSAANDLPPGPPGFLAAYPGYRSTALLDELRATEYSYLDAGGHAYLDYTGAGLPAQAQLAAHSERIRSACFGNPHSDSPASAASTELIERARLAVLAHFNAPPEEYAAIFTPNATGACRLVG